MQRRDFLKILSGAVLALILQPIGVLAAAWNKAAFETVKINDAKSNLTIGQETPSNDIDIVAPDRAENGAIVQIEITSRIPNTEEISVFVENNPTALIGHFVFSNGALPQLVTRIKMADTSDVKVIVKAGNNYYSAAKNVVVLENGCG
ncbi:MAG: thiosulfate oxidation carrier protein SoxY [Methylotenera sp.]|nr:thiosulfate oxidation carrier protein SoxY [Methylotenera sp.]OQW69939.1 MAG: thiosulfate oxidation carrier protein SoxY [Proteobacteria bacterium ST_bin12]